MSLFDRTKVGNNIKIARRKKSAEVGFGYTHKMLADAIEEPARVIAILEAGEYYPDYEHLLKISKVCGITIETLVGEHFTDVDQYIQAIHATTENELKPLKRICPNADHY